MRVLLDTNVFLWILAEDPRLSGAARETFLDEKNDLAFSMAGIWEIFIKCGTGKLLLDEDPARFLRKHLDENGISLLPILFEHTAKLLELPYHHRDPFDRLIIAQALHEKIPVLSSDPIFQEYGVRNLF